MAKNRRQRMRARKLALAAEATAFNLTQERETLQRNAYRLTSDHSEHGGKRKGKRMRVAPRDAAFAYRFDAIDADGRPVAFDADMITHSGDAAISRTGDWHSPGHAALPEPQRLPEPHGRKRTRRATAYQGTGRDMPSVRSDSPSFVPRALSADATQTEPAAYYSNDR